MGSNHFLNSEILKSQDPEFHQLFPRSILSHNLPHNHLHPIFINILNGLLRSIHTKAMDARKNQIFATE